MQSSFEIRVLLFAGAAQAAGRPEVTVCLEPNRQDISQWNDQCITLNQIAEKLRVDFPCLSPLIDRSRWAVDDDFSPLETRVYAHQCIALIPPVSGG
jgi:molybdopterin converting factor small subunit